MTEQVAEEGESGDKLSDEGAIIAELRSRVEDYGGLTVFVRDHPDLDKRNVGKHLSKQLATLPQLLKYLRYLDVAPGEFFESAERRTRE